MHNSKTLSCFNHILYINSLSPSVRASVCLTRRFCVLIHRQNRPGQSDGRTDRFCMGEPAQTDGLYIISTNARWSVSQWAVSLSVTVGIKVDISVVLKRVLKKNQISTSNCLEPGGSLKFFHPPKLGALFYFANFQIPGKTGFEF